MRFFNELLQEFPERLERFITVRGQYEGFHAYENAPAQVAFLKASHRHLFKWKVTIQVFHDDRELEFFMVKHCMDQKVLPYTTMMSNLGSCEMQAERMLAGLVNEYGGSRYYAVTVSEDGENDGTVTWDPSN